MVSDIIELLAADEPIEWILDEYPGLNRVMIREALECAAKVINGKHHVRFKVPTGAGDARSLQGFYMGCYAI